MPPVGLESVARGHTAVAPAPARKDPASLLVYFGVAATLAATSGSLGVAAAYAPTLAVWIFSASSGAHLSPAVTIAVAMRGRFA